jgi:hypothetical protein
MDVFWMLVGLGVPGLAWFFTARGMKSKGVGVISRHVIGAVAAMAAFLLLAVLGPKVEQGSTDTSVSGNCVDRGITYFREIGSYPTLSDGRNAESVVRERCGRTATAF